MYLIHATLRLAPGTGVPDDLGPRMRALAAPQDRLEHVSVHAGARPDPVVGLYLVADSLHDAEARARTLCLRTVAELPGLAGAEVALVGAPLITEYLWDGG
ncbi:MULTISPECIES: hypothetical protein [Kitasatospora]|uniref:Uncharacterized protein n=2 Tax=Kitasatospora TaxID=2063 RepID=A0ABT1IXU6_9ACTN|nr:hypothetical protein [Kitasatospora paracochleata]MCP2309975.1 hypothetical protein [Kitasatospora paracochleata]